MIRKIPILLLTGFLGSGKTTLLRRILTGPGWQDTLVLVNEAGVAGLDHHLVSSAAGSVVALENGCICCTVRSDLGAVLEDLFWQRLHRRIPRFARVVIETTGLADPGPVAAALQGSALLAQRYALERIVCTADALHGAATLARHRESVAQAAGADLVLVTKTDLADASRVTALETLLRGLNPLALLRHAADEGLARLLLASPAPASAPAPVLDSGGGPAWRHRVATLTLPFARPWEAVSFEAALRAVLARHGEGILRIKGMVALDGAAGPLVAQAVQGTLFPFEALERWPSGTRHPHGFLVLIAQGVDAAVLAEPFASHLDHTIKQEDSI